MAVAVHAQGKETDKAGRYRAAVQSITGQETAILASIANDPNPALQRLTLADTMMNLASHYLAIDSVARSTLNQRNEEALNEARKALSKGVIYLEKVVSRFIDAPFSDYEDMLMEINEISPAQRYLMVRKMGLAIDLLENAYGDNSKWRWSFVELEGRYAVIVKNTINLKEIFANTSLDSEHYEPSIRHLMLAKKLLAQAADRYRHKYELSTNNIDDFSTGISFLSALRRMCVVTDDRQEAATAKKKLDAWNIKLASDTEKKGKPDNKKG